MKSIPPFESVSFGSYHAQLIPFLPLLDVAWGDGQLDTAEADIIRRFARERVSLPNEANTQLESWLHKPPTHREYFLARKHLVDAVRFNTTKAIRPSLLSDIAEVQRQLCVAAHHKHGSLAYNEQRFRAALFEDALRFQSVIPQMQQETRALFLDDGARNEHERACFIVNPTSANKNTSQRLAELRALIPKYFAQADIRLTEHRHHATELARQAVANGYSLLVVVGGDGTLHEVINGLVDMETNRVADVTIAAVPAGTGGDFVKTLRVPKHLETALRIAAGDGFDIPMDVALCSYHGHDGKPTSAACLNVAGFGLEGEVVRIVNNDGKRFGPLSFTIATLQAIVTYRPADIRLRYRDESDKWQEFSGPMMSCFLANAQFCGGGMWVGRGGSVTDGLLDMTLIPNLPITYLAPRLGALFDGGIQYDRKVLHARVREIEVSSTGRTPTLIDLDGEQSGSLPLHIRVLQQGVRVRGRWLY